MEPGGRRRPRGSSPRGSEVATSIGAVLMKIYFRAASSRGHPRTTRGYPRPGGNVTKKNRGYPRHPYIPDPPTGISPAAGDIPGRVGDIPGRSGTSPAASGMERGHPRPVAGGIPDRLGDIPGPSGDVPPASWSYPPAHTHARFLNFPNS